MKIVGEGETQKKTTENKQKQKKSNRKQKL